MEASQLVQISLIVGVTLIIIWLATFIFSMLSYKKASKVLKIISSYDKKEEVKPVIPDTSEEERKIEELKKLIEAKKGAIK